MLLIESYNTHCNDWKRVMSSDENDIFSACPATNKGQLGANIDP